jgi:hypothetical protein
MATFNKFTSFVTELGLGTHDLNTDTLKIALTNHLPVSGDTQWSTGNFPEPAAANGYTSGGEDIQNLWSGGTLTATDVVFTATSGGIGPFQYVVMYNDDAANDELVGWYAHSEVVTLQATETFTVNFGASVFTIT